MNKLKRNRILKLAKKAGCDADGDIFIYRGNVYFVKLSSSTVVKTGKYDDTIHERIGFFARWKITFRYPVLYKKGNFM